MKKIFFYLCLIITTSCSNNCRNKEGYDQIIKSQLRANDMIGVSVAIKKAELEGLLNLDTIIGNIVTLDITTISETIDSFNAHADSLLLKDPISHNQIERLESHYQMVLDSLRNIFNSDNYSPKNDDVLFISNDYYVVGNNTSNYNKMTVLMLKQDMLTNEMDAIQRVIIRFPSSF